MRAGIQPKSQRRQAGLAGEEDLIRPSSQLHVVPERHSFGPPSTGERTTPQMATTAQRSAADNPRYPAAQSFLRDVKSVFVDRPAVYQEILRNLNSLWKKPDAVGCWARVEALLATAPRADILARFRDFMPAASIQAWQQSAQIGRAHV